MEPLTLVVAAVAALGVLLIFISLASGSDENNNNRLDNYVAAASSDKAPRKDLGERFAASTALASIYRVVEKRDYGSNLARELARADVALKPSEFLAIRFAAIVGIPLVMILLSTFLAPLGSPLAW